MSNLIAYLAEREAEEDDKKWREAVKRRLEREAAEKAAREKKDE